MARLKYVDSADGTPIAYRVSGSGDPMLLVHGGATSGADWLFVLRLLRDRFTVAIMDRRGRARSGDAPEYAIEREAEDVLAVLDAIGGELLVGHSYGALCSILAAERNDRLRRLVLYEPPIAVRESGVRRMEELIAQGELDAALEGFLRSVGTSEEQFEAIRSSPAWRTLLDAVPTLPRELRACLSWRHLKGPIQVPTLFLLGAETRRPLYLEGLDELGAAFADARRELIPGQQHVAHVFDASGFAKLVADFCEEPLRRRTAAI